MEDEYWYNTEWVHPGVTNQCIYFEVFIYLICVYEIKLKIIHTKGIPKVPILLCTVLDIYQIYTSIHLHTHLQSEQRLVLFALMSQFDGSHNNYNISYRNCIDTILNLSCTIAIMGTFHISKYNYTSNSQHHKFNFLP